MESVLCTKFATFWNVVKLVLRRIFRNGQRLVDCVLAWIGSYIGMAFIRMALNQGGLVFALGPTTGAKFALFTFVMLPDPKVSPATPRPRIWWGLLIVVLDGILRYLEIRYSMFYSLFIHTATLPLVHWITEHRALALRTHAPQGASVPQGA